ncbi:odorant receptor Or1-like isoform X2 [Athalia rosae]|uniref:odorant receptor Or1-like isoform X2 n=1 Tax=Athalia rosae TaxID=37344 RepID=UPI00203367F9|nr:odorant receptor Or1-like isoform X2 [Athalia rosae]
MDSTSGVTPLFQSSTTTPLYLTTRSVKANYSSSNDYRYSSGLVPRRRKRKTLHRSLRILDMEERNGPPRREINAKDALAVNLWILRRYGAWAADIGSSVLRILYNVYGAAMITVVTVTYYSTELVYLYLIWGNLEAITEVSFLLLTHLATAVKLANFLIRRERVEKLVSDTCQEKFLPKDTKHYDILRTTVRKANKENIVFNLMCISTVMAWAIVPLVENNKVRRLPLKTWFPFSTDSTPIYELVYAYEIIAVLINACMNAMLDTFASVLMAVAGCQVDVLCLNLTSLDRSSDNIRSAKERRLKGLIEGESNNVIATLSVAKNRVGNELEKRKERLPVAKEFPLARDDDLLHRRIAGCIEHHGSILRFGKEIQDVFGIGILIQFAVSSTILCLTCFELTLISATSLQFYSMLLYQGCMLFQIYCYCWHGNELKVKTSQLTTAAFNCTWITSSPKFKSSLRIVMCRVQRPMQLMVGGFFSLSLETFSMILRTAYSFYAVLQRVHSNGTN